MESLLSFTQQCLGQLMSYVFRFLSWLIPVTYSFAQTHPTITNITGYLLAAYISWKLLCHLWTVIKRIMLLAVVVLAVLLWSRGLHQVVSEDVPFVVQYLERNSDFQDQVDRFLYHAHPSYLRNYYSTAFWYPVGELRERSIRFLASLSQ
ncbi:LADA_0A05644g1_1 [Lachancea dasiensis]|uniref:LADA_0A05644g1_1 n=1 Tax=Lachancea dasiensis TaxID=1072105 RepID=A0A1G4IPL9_9SACH|nr:LADA_0A05644g1_1 [Lachancea dasiensis]